VLRQKHIYKVGFRRQSIGALGSKRLELGRDRVTIRLFRFTNAAFFEENNGDAGLQPESVGMAGSESPR
jgi:hypothetical protein